MLRTAKTISQRVLNSRALAAFTTLYFLFPFAKGLRPKYVGFGSFIVLSLLATPPLISNIAGKLLTPECTQSAKYNMHLQTGLPLNQWLGETKNGIHVDYMVPNVAGQIAHQNAVVSTGEMVRNFVKENPGLRWVELRRALQMEHTEFSLIMDYLRKESVIAKRNMGRYSVYEVVN